MSQTASRIVVAESSVAIDGPVYFFDVVEDYPEIGGVAAVSRRLREDLGRRLGSRLVAVRGIAASLGCGDLAERYLPRERRAIERLAERDSASTFVIPNFQNPIARIDQRARPRIVNVVHDVQFAHLPELFTAEERAWLTATYAETRANADAVVFVSGAARDDYTRLVGTPATSVVIPAPLGTTTGGTPGCSPQRAPYLLAVQHGDCHPHKNVAGLLRLFAGLSQRCPELRLVVAGRGDHAFREACGRLPAGLQARIAHRGFVPRSELTALYRGARAFVSLSRFEGFNMPAAEAASCGTPLILSDLPVHRDLHAGAACLVDPGSPDLDRVARYLSQEADLLHGYAWPHAGACTAEAVGAAYAELLAAMSRAPRWSSFRQASPTTRVFRVGSGRRRSLSAARPANAAVRRQRLARALLAGTVLSGSAMLVTGLGLRPGPAFAATTSQIPCSATGTNAAGGEAGYTTGSNSGFGGCEGSNNLYIKGQDGTSSSGQYGGGGGGAGADHLTPAGAGGSGDSGATAGGAGGTSLGQKGADGSVASQSYYGGGGGGGGYYGGVLTTNGAGSTGGDGGNGGNGVAGTNSDGGGGGGGGVGTIVGADRVVLSGTSQGGNGGNGGNSDYGGTGAAGQGGVGAIVAIGSPTGNPPGVFVGPDASIRGGTGGIGGQTVGSTDPSPGGGGGVGAVLLGGATLTIDAGGSVYGGAGGDAGTLNGSSLSNDAGGSGARGITLTGPALTFDGGNVVVEGGNGGAGRVGGDAGRGIVFTPTTGSLTILELAAGAAPDLIRGGDGGIGGYGGVSGLGGSGGSGIAFSGATLTIGSGNGSVIRVLGGTGATSVFAEPGTPPDAAAGGNGITLAGTSSLILASGVTVTGGTGGRGNASSAIAGNGGVGGAGVSGGSFVQLAAGATVSGGVGGPAGTRNGTTGLSPGGVGILSGAVTIVNAGQIAGGLSASGTTQASAIEVTSGANGLVMQGTGTVQGGIQVDGGASLTIGQFAGEAPAASVTLANPISGAGSLIASGPGTLILTGSDTVAGGTTVGGGTLQIGNGGAAGSIAGNVVDNAALAFARSDVVTFGGIVSGSGSLIQAGPGTLILTGTNGYTGGTAISGGTLQVGAGGTAGSIMGAITDNGTLAFARSDTLSYGGIISGSGGLNQIGPGTLILTGTNGYTGGTTISGGTLQIGAGGTAGSIMGATTDNAALAFARSDAVTYGGVISGSGSLNQIGSGTLILTGANGYVGGTTISGGTLQIGAGGTAGSITGDIRNNGTLAFARSDTLTYGGVISGSGGLNQIGPGTLNLTGASTYAGPTVVQAGRLAVNGSLGATAVMVAPGATLGGSGTIGGGVTIADGGILAPGNSPGTITVGSLTLTPGRNGSTGSVLAYELGTVAPANGQTSDLTNVAGNLVLAGTLNATDAGGFTYGSYRIFNYGGTLTDNGLAIGSLPAGYTGVVQTVIANQVNLVVASPTTPVQFWDGALTTGNGTIAGGSGTWTNALTNWTDPNGLSNAPWGRGVAVFSGAAGTVTVADTIAFQGLQFATDGYALVPAAGGTLVPTAQAYVRVTPGATATIAAPLTGTGGLQKLSSGTLVLTGANTYTGGTTVSEGTLQLGNGGTTGSIVGNVVDNAALVFDRADAVTFGGVISGTGSLTQAGAGTLRLTAADTFSGTTTIAPGATLALAGAGSIAGSSSLVDGGTFDISQTTGASLPTLAGNGAVVLGSQPLTLTAASSTFGGSLGGAGRLVLQAGTEVLTGTNTYTGGTAIAGGTLQIGDGGTAGSIVGGVSDLGLLAFDRSDAVAFDGAITGAGQVAQLGTGTLRLGGTNSYGGGTAVDAGTLAVGSDRALGTGGLMLADGTTFRAAVDGLTIGNATSLAGTATIDTQAFGLALTGPLSGTGTLDKAGSGTLTLTGTGTYSGGTRVLAGTLDIGNGRALGSGPLSLDAGTTLGFTADLSLGNAVRLTGAADPTIDTGPNTDTVSGTISGPGALTKTGTGTLILTGADSSTGATTVAAGTLEVDGSAAGSAATVDAGATLSGSGTVGSITARSGATVAPGSAASPYGVLHTPGSAAFFAGSTYQVNIGPTGQTSALAVGGTASLGGAAVTVASAPGNYDLATRYDILTATGGIQGRFGALTTATALAFLNPTLTYSANAVTLAFQSNGVSLGDIALTSNEKSVAAAVQSLDPNSVVVRSLQGLSQAQARIALDQLAGATHASVATTASQGALRVSTQILDRLWNIGGGDIDARTLLQQLGGPGELPAFVNCYAPLPPPASRTPPTLVTAWGEGFGDFGHDGADRNGAGLDRSLGGFVIGYDAPLHGLGAPLRIGIAGGYTNTSFSGTGSGGTGSNGTFESVFGSLYGGARYGAVDLRGGITAAGTSTTVDRAVAYPGFSEAEHSVYGGNTEQVFAELGYRFSGTRWVVEPVVDAAYTHVHMDSYRERGGAAALFGFAQDNDLGTTTLGARAEYAPFVGIPLVGRAFLGWRHGFGDIDPATKLAFEAGSLPFTAQGAAIDRNALASEVGLDWRYSASTTLGLAYIGQVGPRDSDNGVKGRFEYKF